MAERRIPSGHSETFEQLQAVARGDEVAIARLYQTHADRVLRFILRRVSGSYEDSQEITQDTFLTALSLASNFDGTCSAFTWLCGIAKLRIIDFHRRTNRDKRIPPQSLVSLEEEDLDSSPDSESERALERVLERFDGQGLLREILQSLPEHEREVLVLRYQDELLLSEIAALMNRTEKAVERLLARARRNASLRGAQLIRSRLGHSESTQSGPRDGMVN